MRLSDCIEDTIPYEIWMEVEIERVTRNKQRRIATTTDPADLDQGDEDADTEDLDDDWSGDCGEDF